MLVNGSHQLGVIQSSVDRIVLSHAFEDQKLMEHVDSVKEAEMHAVSLEADGRKQNIFQLPLIGAEMGHDLHSDVQQLFFGDSFLPARGHTPGHGTLSDEHPLEKVDGSSFFVDSARNVVNERLHKSLVGQYLGHSGDIC